MSKERPSPAEAMQPTILLVDSYAPYRNELADRLREERLAVLEAHNGVEGLRIVRERLPSLVVVDLWPFFSATLQMVERLRAGESTARIPVIVVTSIVTPEYRSRAFAAGCAGYLEKPCPPDRVLAEVRTILAGRGGETTLPSPFIAASPGA